MKDRINSRLTNIPVSFSHHDNIWAQARTYATGDNSNDPEADHLTFSGPTQEWPPGYERSCTADARVIPVCRFYAVEKISATGFSLVR